MRITTFFKDLLDCGPVEAKLKDVLEEYTEQVRGYVPRFLLQLLLRT